MAIIETLEAVNLHRFAAPLALMLERISAVEVALECSEDCAEALLRRQLRDFAATGPNEVREPLAQFCVGLPALCYRIGASADAAVWHPLREPLTQFRERHGESLIWYEGDPLPTLPEILVWFRTWGC